MVNIDKIRERYPVGTRVRLVHMEDPFAPPIGTLGTVEAVDDIGSLIVAWDNGQSLHVLHGIDKVVIVQPQRDSFICAIYDYLIHGHNGHVFDSGQEPISLSHEEVIALMTSPNAKELIDVFVDECSYFHLEPSLQLTVEEIEKVIDNH